MDLMLSFTASGKLSFEGSHSSFHSKCTEQKHSDTPECGRTEHLACSLSRPQKWSHHSQHRHTSNGQAEAGCDVDPQGRMQCPPATIVHPQVDVIHVQARQLVAIMRDIEDDTVQGTDPSSPADHKSMQCAVSLPQGIQAECHLWKQ